MLPVNVTLEKISAFFTLPEYGLHKNVVFFVFLAMVSAALTYICRRHVLIMDRATARSMHVGAVPRSGGLAIVITFILGLIIYYVVHEHYFRQDVFWGFFISSVMVAIVSFYDDITGGAFAYKVVSQLVGVAVLFLFGLVIQEITIPYYGLVQLGIWGYPLTALWIVGFTNAFNFMDGINGMAAGVAAAIAITFSILAWQIQCGFISHVCYIISAGCLGFLLFNYPKASIFMGDVGSTFLGFSFAAMAILAANYAPVHIPFMAIPIFFMNFIIETLYTFLWRLASGDNVFQAHKSHTYQLLSRLGCPSKYVTLVYYVQSLLLVIVGVTYIRVGNQHLKMLMLISTFLALSAYVIVVRMIASRRLVHV